VKSVNRRIFFSMVVALILFPFHLALAQAKQAKVYRVGVILQGGLFYTIVDGLRDGLKELGLVEGKQVLLEIRDTRGDLKAVEEAARSLEREKVDLLHTLATSVTIEARRATADIPSFSALAPTPSLSGSWTVLLNQGAGLRVCTSSLGT
jgi:putative tryptophan/tyrosine transport system substrate-binding protein